MVTEWENKIDQTIATFINFNSFSYSLIYFVIVPKELLAPLSHCLLTCWTVFYNHTIQDFMEHRPFSEADINWWSWQILLKARHSWRNYCGRIGGLLDLVLTGKVQCSNYPLLQTHCQFNGILKYVSWFQTLLPLLWAFTHHFWTICVLFLAPKSHFSSLFIWTDYPKTCKFIYSVDSVCERTIPTERPPLVGEVSTNFCR
jgi:hypothetical protein